MIYSKLGFHIVKLFCQDHCEGGEFECDESYFGPGRVRGNRGRGAVGKRLFLAY